MTMETSNETVADILREMRSNPLCWLMPEGIPQMCHDNAELTKFADRIEAAHRAALDALCHNVAIE